MQSLPIERALMILGQRLEYLDAPRTTLLVGGGAALNLLGLVIRTTQDVDVIALVSLEGEGVKIEKAAPLPEYLREASEQVARDLGLPATWLNPGPVADELLAAAQWAKTHDPSEGFHQELVGMLRQLGHAGLAERL